MERIVELKLRPPIATAMGGARERNEEWRREVQRRLKAGQCLLTECKYSAALLPSAGHCVCVCEEPLDGHINNNNIIIINSWVVTSRPEGLVKLSVVSVFILGLPNSIGCSICKKNKQQQHSHEALTQSCVQSIVYFADFVHYYVIIIIIIIIIIIHYTVYISLSYWIWAEIIQLILW